MLPLCFTVLAVGFTLPVQWWVHKPPAVWLVHCTSTGMVEVGSACMLLLFGMRFLLACLLCCQAAFAQQAADTLIHPPPSFASIPHSTKHDTACCSDSNVGAAPAAVGEEGGADAESLAGLCTTHIMLAS